MTGPEGALPVGVRAGRSQPSFVSITPPAASGNPSGAVVFDPFGSTARRLSDFEGRPLVVNYFASWCDPCEDELKILEQARKLLAESRVTYPIASDLSGETLGQLMKMSPTAKRFAIPITFLIDARGQVAATHVGALDVRRTV